MDCQWFTRVTLRAPSVIAGGAPVCLPLTASAESQLHADQAVPHTQQCPINSVVGGKLKGKRSSKTRWLESRNGLRWSSSSTQRIMEHLTNDPQAQAGQHGMFNTQTMMHQYVGQAVRTFS